MTDTDTTQPKPTPFPVRPIRMPAQLWDRAVAEGERTGTTGSATVRAALEAYLGARDALTHWQAAHAAMQAMGDRDGARLAEGYVGGLTLALGKVEA